MTPTRERPPDGLRERLERTRAAHRAGSRLYRVLLVPGSAIVTLAGVAMLGLPAPALALIPAGPFLLARLERARESHRARGRLYRILFVAGGAVVTLAGVAMLVLPGPALAVIPVGLFMLSMEFAWAESLLVRALEHAERARETAKATSRAQRVLGAIAAALAVAGVAVAAVLWDLPVLPV